MNGLDDDGCGSVVIVKGKWKSDLCVVVPDGEVLLSPLLDIHELERDLTTARHLRQLASVKHDAGTIVWRKGRKGFRRKVVG